MRLQVEQVYKSSQISGTRNFIRKKSQRCVNFARRGKNLVHRNSMRARMKNKNKMVVVETDVMHKYF